MPLMQGEQVRKIHPYDGSKYAGKPTGAVLTILRLDDHRPVDGKATPNCVAHLSNGTWEFTWNLTTEGC